MNGTGYQRKAVQGNSKIIDLKVILELIDHRRMIEI